MRKTPLERFMEKVNVSSTGCWEWTSGTDRNGYGLFGFNGKQYRAHRWSAEFIKQTNPNSLYVCHSCDNPGCVNPDHLWLGTHTENEQDKDSKGRRRSWWSDPLQRDQQKLKQAEYLVKARLAKH
jgi:hypothetical protein